MRNYILYWVVSLFSLQGNAQQPSNTELKRWEDHVNRITIIRDEWDIPHVYGKTDADAVFGLMYAQCQENFPQIEKNFLEMLGRRAELEGPTALYDDLMMQLIQDSVEAVKDFERSPDWFKKLLVAHADGINYYLYKNPTTIPSVLKKFKPWYHLMWTDGSVSPTRTAGLSKKEVAAFYGNPEGMTTKNIDLFKNWVNDYDMEAKTLKGSNGFAIAPKHSKSGAAMLYINPHVPFYFRSEMHMVSEEGLNAYGAVTWGQFFIYQGFNEFCGWMHTTGYADVADVYEEKVNKENNHWVYEFEAVKKPILERNIQLKYQDKGILKTTSFLTYKTHHGPIMGKKNGKWLSLQENNRSLDALIECWVRTKSKHFEEYKKAMELVSNNSNNTVYADAAGNIAYWHGNFVPKRDPSYDFSLPVDGSIKATDWQGVHALDEIVHLINPENGWLQNCNATPFAVAGKYSPDPNKFPKYMAPDGQNGRGLNAVRLLENIEKIDLNALIQIGYNKHLIAFDLLLPNFIAAAKKESLSARVNKAVDYLAAWDHNADSNSIATAIAIEWATQWAQEIPPAKTEEAATNAILKYELMDQNIPIAKKITLLEKTLDQFEKWYGTWEIQWGAINRYQRVNPGENFEDTQPSIAVAQASSKWGSLPSFESKRYPGTVKRYGYTGNSFVAAVEFGEKLNAKTIITGGQSRFANSKHFTDQAQNFIDGNFKKIHYYKEDVLAHKVVSYKPGLER